MLIRHIALVSDTKQISASELTKVGAALSKQASRDFAPIWGIQANVHAFAKLEDVPLGYWPVIVRDDIMEPGAAGYHTDDKGSPFALVQYDRGWSLNASFRSLREFIDFNTPTPMEKRGMLRSNKRILAAVQLDQKDEQSCAARAGALREKIGEILAMGK